MRFACRASLPIRSRHRHALEHTQLRKEAVQWLCVLRNTRVKAGATSLLERCFLVTATATHTRLLCVSMGEGAAFTRGAAIRVGTGAHASSSPLPVSVASCTLVSPSFPPSFFFLQARCNLCKIDALAHACSACAHGRLCHIASLFSNSQADFPFLIVRGVLHLALVSLPSPSLSFPRLSVSACLPR